MAEIMPQFLHLLHEWAIYGNDSYGRVAVVRPDGEKDKNGVIGKVSAEKRDKTFNETNLVGVRTILEKYYEIKDHLGNVRLVLMDQKKSVNDDNQAPFAAIPVELNNYYPFGMPEAGRSWSYQGEIFESQSKYQDYTYGYNGMQRDNSKSIGSGYTTLFREYDPEIARWKSLDPKLKDFPSESPFSAMGNNPIKNTDVLGDENIAVAGFQSDNSKGNKWMFVNQALKELREWKESSTESAEPRTLVLFKGNYSDKEIGTIAKSVSQLGGNLVLVNSKDEFVNYINSKSIKSANLSDERTNDKITDMAIYAHGHPEDISFGYEGDEKLRANSATHYPYQFRSIHISSLNKNAFSKTTYNKVTIRLYTCRAALARGNSFCEMLYNEMNHLYTLGQELANQTGVTVSGYARRVDYGVSLFDRPFYTPPSEFLLGGGLFNPNGASHNPFPGDSPWYATPSLIEFYPRR